MENLVELYNQGEPVAKIAELTGISVRTVYRKIESLKSSGAIQKRTKRVKRGTSYAKLVGTKIWHLQIIGTETYKNNSYKLRCVCDCGQNCVGFKHSIFSGEKKTCGRSNCLFHRQDYTNYGDKNVNFKGHKGIHGSKWSGMKAAAKRRNLLFDIDIKETWDLYEKQNRKCAMTGLTIEFGKTYKKGNTASLDRINSEQGYVANNVHWVHKDINKMKMDLNIERFKELCALVTNPS